MSYSYIETSQPAEKVYKVVLNRPREFNALNRQILEELNNALIDFEHSENEFLILTGAGRAFCFGADFQEFEQRTSLPTMLDLFQQFVLNLYHCTKITIASLNGFATGAGLDLALACDFRIASEKIKLGQAYISMGLVSDGGGSYLLPRLIGLSRALEMMLTGDAISAEKGLEIGLVHRVCAPAELNDKTIQLVMELGSKPTMARQLLKKLLKNTAFNLEAALQQEREAQTLCFEDAEHQQLAAEFLRKRKKG